MTDFTVAVPDVVVTARQYRDYFARNGLTKATLLKAVDLTYQRSEVFFGDVYAYLAQKGQHIACKGGCAFCCHTVVSVLPPEAFYIADFVENHPDAAEIRDRVIAHDSAHRGKSGAQRYIEHIPCSFLAPKTRLCSIHPQRPLTCRSMHSLDKGPCEKAFEAKDAYLPAPSHQLFFDNTSLYYDAMATALDPYGVQFEALELNAALAIIFSEPRIFQRWLKGEEVFSEALVDHAMVDVPPEEAKPV